VEEQQGLEVRLVDGIVQLHDPRIATWVTRFEPVAEPASSGSRSSAAAFGLAAGLVEATPGLADLLRSRGVLRVVFSPEMRRGLADGTYRIMGDSLPIAVNRAGRAVEIARVPAADLATAGAGAGIGAGAFLAGAWPLVLAAGVATAAAMAQQRWLERAFSGLEGSLERIEARLRDDDLGVLDAADRLVDLVGRFDDLELPPQLRREVAVARQAVDAVYFSRRRFVQRFKDLIERAQVESERHTGEPTPWPRDVVEQVGEGVAAAEIVVFVRAMVARARLGAVTAGVLASEGAPVAALQLLDEVHDTLRPDYWDLQRRLAALARAEPESPFWRRLIDRQGAETAIATARSLADAMHLAVGERLTERDEPLVLGSWKFE
jgi:hypothetical protein